MAKEEEKQRIEKMIESERQKQENERKEIEAKKEADRRNAENSLPPEPQNANKPITKIRFRKPTGEYIERKFLADTQLQVIKLSLPLFITYDLDFSFASVFRCYLIMPLQMVSRQRNLRSSVAFRVEM